MSSAGWAAALAAVALVTWPTTVRLRRLLSPTTGQPSDRGGIGHRVKCWVRVAADAMLSLTARTSRWIAVGLGMSVALLAVPAGLGPIGSAVAGGATTAATAALRRSMAIRRRRAWAAVDAEAVMAVAAEIRAGQPVPAALDVAAGVAAPPTADAFRRASARVRLGADPEDLLLGSTSTTAQRVGKIWRVSARSGCPLADALEGAAEDLGSRCRTRTALQALLAGPRATALLLSALPIFGIVLGNAVGARPWAILTGTTAGGIALAAGATLTGLGLAWTGAIVRQADGVIGHD